HIGAALFLFGIARRTTERPGMSLAIALLWLVHPLQTESVTYVVQRTELLAGFFMLLTLYCVIRQWNAPAVAACALAMGSKEVAVRLDPWAYGSFWCSRRRRASCRSSRRWRRSDECICRWRPWLLSSYLRRRDCLGAWARLC